MKNELAVQDWSWEITKRCNLNCLHCISGKEHCDRELTTEESLKAISCIARLGGKNLRLTGGEPLMRKRSRSNNQGSELFEFRRRSDY